MSPSQRKNMPLKGQNGTPYRTLWVFADCRVTYPNVPFFFFFLVRDAWYLRILCANLYRNFIAKKSAESETRRPRCREALPDPSKRCTMAASPKSCFRCFFCVCNVACLCPTSAPLSPTDSNKNKQKPSTKNTCVFNKNTKPKPQQWWSSLLPQTCSHLFVLPSP